MADPAVTGTIDSHIDHGANALITLSSAWGIGLTILIILILGSIAIIIVYLRWVAPIRSSNVKDIAALREEMLSQQKQMLAQQAIKPPAEQHMVDASINTKIKALFAELDRVKIRVEKLEGNCPKHQQAISEVVAKMQVINETLPQALESIGSLSDRVWDIALKGQTGANKR